MGNKISAPKLTQEDFDVIAKEIGKEDIKDYYEKFLRLFPGGKAPKQDFLKRFPAAEHLKVWKGFVSATSKLRQNGVSERSGQVGGIIVHWIEWRHVFTKYVKLNKLHAETFLQNTIVEQNEICLDSW